MKKFLRLTLILFVLFTGVIIAIRAIIPTTLSRPSVISAVFTTADKAPCSMPCLFGIHPGLTKLKDAIFLLNVHPTLIDAQCNLSDQYATCSDPQAGFEVLLHGEPNGVVENIEFIIEDRLPHLFQPTFGDVLLQFGAPNGERFNDTYFRTLFFDNMILHAKKFDTRVSMNSQVQLISMVASGLDKNKWSPWQGFSNYAHYKK